MAKGNNECKRDKRIRDNIEKFRKVDRILDKRKKK